MDSRPAFIPQVSIFNLLLINGKKGIPDWLVGLEPFLLSLIPWNKRLVPLMDSITNIE